MIAAAPDVVGRVALAVHDSFESCRGLREEWDRLAIETRATVCLSFDHCATWWKHYGEGRSLEILEFRADGALVGVLPMFVGRVWLGPAWLSLAALVGSDSTLVVHDLPVRDERAREVFALALARLVGERRCDAVRFAPIAANETHVAAIREAARGLGEATTIVRDAEAAPYTVFHLPETFDAYLASLSKNHRGNFRRGMKALRESFGVRADVVDRPGELLPEFDRFRSMHDAQWRAEGKLGHFGDWPKSESYHRDLLAAHGAAGRAHLLRLVAGDEVVSSQLCYSLGGSLHWFLPARVLRADLEKQSLGRIGLVQMIEFAIGAGFRRIEGGVGRYDYKLQLGATEHVARSIVVAGPGALRLARLRAFERLSDALHFAYYKAWFQRVAPRLPLARRPLWRTWIRSRL